MMLRDSPGLVVRNEWAMNKASRSPLDASGRTAANGKVINKKRPARVTLADHHYGIGHTI